MLIRAALPSPTTAAISRADDFVVVLTASMSKIATTGTVIFYSGTTTVGIATVFSGVATTSTMLLPAGTDSVMAVYSSDTTYASSTGAAVNIVV